MSLSDLFEEPDQMLNYCSLLYYRGFEGGGKEGTSISASTVQQERRFRGQGVSRKQRSYFLDGLVLGSEEKIKEWTTLFLKGDFL